MIHDGILLFFMTIDYHPLPSLNLGYVRWPSTVHCYARPSLLFRYNRRPSLMIISYLLVFSNIFVNLGQYLTIFYDLIFYDLRLFFTVLEYFIICLIVCEYLRLSSTLGYLWLPSTDCSFPRLSSAIFDNLQLSSMILDYLRLSLTFSAILD